MAYQVPKEMQHAYKMAVQRANRRVKQNIKYIQKHVILDDQTQRTLVAGFMDHEKWASATMPFSRSNKGRYLTDPDTGRQTFREFTSKADFDAYMRHLNKWGEDTGKRGDFAKSPQRIKNDYKTAIIKALNEVKDHYSISLPGGKLPKQVIDMIDSLSLTQITNFFGDGDPSEDIEVSQFDSDDFIYVDTAEDFINVVETRINAIKKFI